MVTGTRSRWCMETGGRGREGSQGRLRGGQNRQLNSRRRFRLPCRSQPSQVYPGIPGGEGTKSLCGVCKPHSKFLTRWDRIMRLESCTVFIPTPHPGLNHRRRSRLATGTQHHQPGRPERGLGAGCYETATGCWYQALPAYISDVVGSSFLRAHPSEYQVPTYPLGLVRL